MTLSLKNARLLLILSFLSTPLRAATLPDEDRISTHEQLKEELAPYIRELDVEQGFIAAQTSALETEDITETIAYEKFCQDLTEDEIRKLLLLEQNKHRKSLAFFKQTVDAYIENPSEIFLDNFAIELANSNVELLFSILIMFKNISEATLCQRRMIQKVYQSGTNKSQNIPKRLHQEIVSHKVSMIGVKNIRKNLVSIQEDKTTCSSNRASRILEVLDKWRATFKYINAQIAPELGSVYNELILFLNFECVIAKYIKSDYLLKLSSRIDAHEDTMLYELLTLEEINYNTLNRLLETNKFHQVKERLGKLSIEDCITPTETIDATIKTLHQKMGLIPNQVKKHAADPSKNKKPKNQKKQGNHRKAKQSKYTHPRKKGSKNYRQQKKNKKAQSKNQNKPTKKHPTGSKKSKKKPISRPTNSQLTTPTSSQQDASQNQHLALLSNSNHLKPDEPTLPLTHTTVAQAPQQTDQASAQEADTNTLPNHSQSKPLVHENDFSLSTFTNDHEERITNPSSTIEKEAITDINNDLDNQGDDPKLILMSDQDDEDEKTFKLKKHHKRLSTSSQPTLSDKHPDQVAKAMGAAAEHLAKGTSGNLNIQFAKKPENPHKGLDRNHFRNNYVGGTPSGITKIKPIHTAKIFYYTTLRLHKEEFEEKMGDSKHQVTEMDYRAFVDNVQGKEDLSPTGIKYLRDNKLRMLVPDLNNPPKHKSNAIYIITRRPHAKSPEFNDSTLKFIRSKLLEGNYGDEQGYGIEYETLLSKVSAVTIMLGSTAMTKASK